jgi:hypothetical protein
VSPAGAAGGERHGAPPHLALLGTLVLHACDRRLQRNILLPERAGSG